MENQIDWDFISSLEGKGVKTGYVPDVENSQSGVTVGTGFDLGSKNVEFLQNLNLDMSLIEKLTPYLGLRGAQASEMAPSLTLDDDQVAQLDISAKKWYAGNIIKQFNSKLKTKFKDLTSAQQTVIASVGFQYGNLDRVPNFFNQVINGKWQEVINNLRNFGDKYGTRRNKEADFLESDGLDGKN